MPPNPPPAEPLAVDILGPLEVAVGGRAVPLSGARLRALLTRLALNAGEGVGADALAAAVWPEDAPADPVAAVRSLVTRLRRALPGGAIASVPGGYRLDAEVDAHRFRRLAASGRSAEALALWRGVALADLPDAIGARAALEERRLAAVEDRAEAEIARGEGASAVADLSELAAAHPFRERLHALLFRALREAGRGAEALTAYEELRRRLADELGADPGAELREVHLELLGPEPPRRPRGNLRAALTSFVGREAEIEQVGAALRGSRLVTVCGPGGVGKTRLLATVAAGLGGAWMAELASVTDPADVPAAVAQAVGTAEIDPRAGDAVERLAEALGTRPVLLLLDNCEHVIEAAADLADRLLGRCPELRIGATSREPLAITGETVCQLRPLPTDAAVRLFTDRARAARPDLALDREAAAEVCRRLDGLPLAIELAAAKLRVLPLDELAARLDDRFRLLTGGSRTALPRHQTLRAVVAWSWDLLDAAERDLAEAASVFGGGLSIASAEWIGGSLETLTALADKSILRPTGTGRFQMLETLREYGQARLEETGRLAKAREAHAAYFLDLAERAEPHLRRREQLEWMALLEAEHDNILAALHGAAALGDADTAVRIVAAMAAYWMFTGARHELGGWIDTALDVPGPADERARLVAEGMRALSAATGGMLHPDEITEEMEDLVERAADHLDHPLLAIAEPLMLGVLDRHGPGLAAIDARLDHPDPWVRSFLRFMRALLLEDQGEMDDMRRELERAAEGFREIGDRLGLRHTLTWLARADLMSGDAATAVAALEESIVLQRRFNPADQAIETRTLLAGVLVVEGETERAREALEAIVADAETEEWDLGAFRGVVFAYLGLGDLARVTGELEDADRYYTAAEAPVRDGEVQPPQWAALMARARLLLALAEGDTARARELLPLSIDHAMDAQDMPVLAKTAVGAAAIEDADGRPEAAAELLGAAERLRGSPDRYDVDTVALERRLRDRLGEAAFAAARTAGRAPGREAALRRLDQLRRR